MTKESFDEIDDFKNVADSVPGLGCYEILATFFFIYLVILLAGGGEKKRFL